MTARRKSIRQRRAHRTFKSEADESAKDILRHTIKEEYGT